ncbi:uncharacterized protein C8A04DRAFT_34706 [Dichotomopilus funicola]|uniref:Pentatricopeptide repeat protein n=1 Tax=Dichotomopilus funicola TaxID=1934379 RepID=A0AAN6V8M1_9PEZI|nr:hypothetical protein C8A04DRAFT_34706 [Dichotomopilus funicola]
MSTKRRTVDALSRALCPAIDELILSRATPPVLLSSRSDPTHRQGHARHTPSSYVSGVRGVHTGPPKHNQQPRRKKLKTPEWATAPLPTLRPKPVVVRRDSEPLPEPPKLDHFPSWALNEITLPAPEAEPAIAKEPPVPAPTDKPAAPNPKLGSVDAATIIQSAEDLPRETPFALTSVIYEVLRSLRKQKDQGNKIRRLVQFLVEQRGEPPNALLYEALVTANWDTATGSADELVAIYKDMEAAGVAPSPGWYHSALRLLAIHPDYLSRNRYLKRMKESSVALTDDGKFSVALGLLRDGQTEMALDCWDEMRRSKMQIPEWVSSIFFYALMMRGVVDEALQLFQEILEMAGNKPEGVPLILWSYLLDECSRNLHYEGTRFVWDTMVTPGTINPADGILLNVLNTAARHGDAALATTVVELLAAREARVGLHHYEPLMESYVQGGELESSFRVLCIMNDAGLVPDHSGTRPILAALRQAPELRVPAAAINVVLEARIVNTTDAAAAAAATATATSTSTSQPTPQSPPYWDETNHNPNTNPDPDLTSLLTLYRQLANLSISGPNEQTFLLLLDQCTHTQPAAFLLSEMDRFAIRPTPAILRHLIRCFAHDGDLDVALGYAAELGRLSPSVLARAHSARAARARMARMPQDRLSALLRSSPYGKSAEEEGEEEATDKAEEVDQAPLSLREVCRYVLDERTLWVLARRCGEAKDPRVWELAAAVIRRSRRLLFTMGEAVKWVDGVPRLDGRESVGLEAEEVQKELEMMGFEP